MIKCLIMVYSRGRMEKFIKDIFKIIKKMEMEVLCIKMVMYMLDNGKII